MDEARSISPELLPPRLLRIQTKAKNQERGQGIDLTRFSTAKSPGREGFFLTGRRRHRGVPEHAADQVDASWLAAFRNRSGPKGTGLLGGQFVRRYDRASGLMVFFVIHI
ncbi:predicted protein [Histoplasma capsulatum H143]|nr:predicted protein [Histoplasma capsulatum H143]